MESKETLNINKIVKQKKTNFFVESDVIIPDTKPDILNSISTSGNICIYKKDVTDSKIRFDGGICVYLMYVADNETNSVRCLNTTLDFTYVLEDDKCKNNMQSIDKMEIKTIECKVLNGRKINLKVSVEVTTTLYEDEEVEIINEVEGAENIQTLRENMSVNSLVGKGSTKTYAKDTMVLDSTDKIDEILKCNVEILNKDFKISYNKILAKADVHVKVMYRTEEGEVNTKETVIPIMGFIDMPDVAEDNICDIDYTLSNIVITPNSDEEHSIYIEVEVNLSCMVYENKNIDIIQDLYSPNKRVNFSKKEIKVEADKRNISEVCNIRQKIEVQEIGQNKILNVEVRPVINNIQILNGKIIYQGDIELEFIFETENSSNMGVKKQNISYDFTVEIEGTTKNHIIQTSIEVLSQDFIVVSDGTIDVKVDLLFNIAVSKTKAINAINEIEMTEENRTPYSMTIYFVKPGDTLWNIAKRFGSTIDDISRVNNIEDQNNIFGGQQLFIPRFVM